MTQPRSWLWCPLVGVYLLVPSAMGQETAVYTVLNEAFVEAIVAREEAASERTFDPVFRAKAKELLAALPLAALVSQTGENGLGLNSLGDSQADLVYTAVTPCRIIDTRLAGGPLAAGFTRSFKVTGDTTSQGGANCGIPFGPATSAMINFVAVDAVGRGNLQITPFGQALPLSSIINYSAGLNVANGLAVALCNPSAATCINDVTIKANVSAAHLVADVQGYFQRVSTGGVGTVLLADAAVTAPKISPGVVVRSLNAQTDAVTLAGSNGLGVSASAGTVTVSSNATAANTAGAIVARDASSNFSAGTITLAAGMLASGQTMRGTWTVGGFPATAAGQFVSTAFTFPFTLPSAPAAPNANFIAFGGASTVSCPGTHDNPQAAAGQLCVYVTNCTNANVTCIGQGSAGSCGTADPYGAFVAWVTAAAGQVFCYGTWAVTAP